MVITNTEIKHCLTTFKTHLESNDSEYVYVNELRYPSTKKAVRVSLLCIDFGAKAEAWSDKDKTNIIYFWVPRRMSFPHCGDGCNAKIPKWLAIKNIEKQLSEME
jgi:hypothetical protein